jgi:hypothetical protein
MFSNRIAPRVLHEELCTSSHYFSNQIRNKRTRKKLPTSLRPVKKKKIFIVISRQKGCLPHAEGYFKPSYPFS